MVHDPRHRRTFEKLLRLAASRGDADIVTERLGWGIDPNCHSPKGRTPLIANVSGSCPSAATIKALLAAGADPDAIDLAGLRALDYARRKLARLQLRPRKPPRRSHSLDENNQLQLPPHERAHMDELRKLVAPERDRDFTRMWWKERLRAARRVFNDPGEVEKIVQMLEEAERTT